ncbi:MAG: GDSL-type esterase/lipase family protein [Planctomycetaceae bacterium]
MTRYLLTLATLVAATTVVAEEAPYSSAKWEPEIQKFEQADKEHPPEAGRIVFWGSSTMRLWPTGEMFTDLPVVNRGFGGSRMADALYYFDRVVVPHRPKVILMYEGSNDLAGGVTPSQIDAEFREIIQRCRDQLPDTHLVFLSIKPTVKRWPIIHRIRATNALIEATCIDSGDHVHYLDVHTPMLNAEGTPEVRYLSNDGLHLGPEGYKHLTELVRPKLKELLESPAAAPSAN